MFISLLVFLVILGLVAWLVGLIPMEATISQVVRVVFILIAVLAVFDSLGVTHFGVLQSF